MKKLIVCVFIIMFGVVIITGCKNSAEEDMDTISVTVLPENKEYERTYTSKEKVLKIVDYLNGLTLEEEFTENPDEYAGMTYVITLAYQGEGQAVYYHFGNRFLKLDGELGFDWRRMNYGEASQLESIILNTPSD